MRVRALLSRSIGAWSLVAFAMSTASAGERALPATPPVIPAFERFFGKGNDAAEGGQILLTELNCIACHKAEATPGAPGKKAAPVLDNVGQRIKPEYFRAFLSNPPGVKPGTAMPDLFAGDPEREAKIEALTHFLASTGSPKNERPDGKQIGLGRDLYTKVGCVACHGTRNAKGEAETVLPDTVPLPDLKAKYTIATLKSFLENPHQARPSGRMPSLLNAKEAGEVANYLLQGIAFTAPGGGGKDNMSFACYEGSWEKLPDFSKLKPVATGKATDFDVGVAVRNENVALKFEGFLRIDTDGEYRFSTNSDDGSRLWVDDKLVVDNDGIHAPAEKSGSAKLTKGMHKLVVAVFNGSAGFELSVEIDGPGIGRSPLGPLVSLTSDGKKVDAPVVKTNAFQLDSALAEKGRKVFASAGCVSCHQMNNVKDAVATTATPLAKLRPDEGCLAPKAHAKSPSFALSPTQRSALAAALKSTAAPTPAELVKRTMFTFNCYACHEREKVGGPKEELNTAFETTQKEMGDEGRLPPSLTGVGAKLKPAYFQKILDKGSHDRPYMHTRMPGFGDANVGQLVKLLGELDTVAPVAAVKFHEPLSKVKAEARQLVGAQGAALGCIRCHTFAGNKAEGVQGIDMVLMTERLNHDWFHRYLINPNAYRPGTRMPAAWPDGKSLLTKVLDGSADTQIEAIWAYLSDGTRAQLPIGTKKNAIPLTPEKDAIIYRNFIEGAGPRAIGVGYPEKANLAFDANELRLAMIWHGAFMDASRHWTDRGVGYEPPLGDSIIHLPPGSGFAVLSQPDEAWPTKPARELGGVFHGYTLSKDERPTFKYAIGGVTIEDRPDAVAGKSLPTVRRSFTLTAPADTPKLYFRAASGSKIEAVGDGWYSINGEYRIKIDGATPQLRRVGDRTELVVPLTFANGRAQFVEEIAW